MLTLQDIHSRIERCIDRMESLVDEVTIAASDAATAEATFKAEFAKARLKARAEADGRKITTDEAEDHATVKTEGQRLSYLLTTNNLTVLREALRAIQSEMDGLRTQAASFRQAGG